MSTSWLCCPVSPSSPFFLGCCSHNAVEMMGALHGKDLVPQRHGAVPTVPLPLSPPRRAWQRPQGPASSLYSLFHTGPCTL